MLGTRSVILLLLFLVPATYRRFPGWGSNWSCSCWPMPQPQQCQIRAVLASLCHSHSNTASELHLWPIPQLSAIPDALTHWARSGIELTSSWTLVRFLTDQDTVGTSGCSFLYVGYTSMKRFLKNKEIKMHIGSFFFSCYIVYREIYKLEGWRAG